MHLVEWLSKHTEVRQLEPLGREGSAGTHTCEG